MSHESHIVIHDTLPARILTLHGQKVMIDADLAELYGIPTKAPNQAVKRNHGRFPTDFMFQLTFEEKAEVVTNCDHLSKQKFSKSQPFAFTGFGAIQAPNIINSPQAVEMGIYVLRAFVRLREVLASTNDLAKRLNALEEKTEAQSLQQNLFANNTRTQLKQVFDAIRQLMAPPAHPSVQLDSQQNQMSRHLAPKARHDIPSFLFFASPMNFAW